MTDLYSKYGHCIIPKGTRLYRSAENSQVQPIMFFALQSWVAGAFSKNTTKGVQVWETLSDTKILFMVNSCDYRSWTESAIVDIYKAYYPTSNEQLNDLDIKHFDKERLKQFTSRLNKDSIIGWFSSLEDAIELEVCLFANPVELESVIEFKSILQPDEEDHSNSLNQIEVFPTARFYANSKEKLERSNSSFDDYKQMKEAWIEEEVNDGRTEEQSRNYYFNLRLKLKI